MTIGIMRQPTHNQPRYKWYQKRKHRRIPNRAESKWWLDKYFTKVDYLAPPIAVGTLPTWSFTNNTGTKTYNASVGFSGLVTTYSLISPPAGISINSSTGVITANSAVTAAGTPTLNIQASNAQGYAIQPLATNIAIMAPITVGSLGTWTEVQNTGSKTFNASVGFSGASITYTLAAAVTGYSINASTGVVTVNTATAGVGTRTVTVRATNVSGFADQAISSVISSGLAAPVAVGTIGPWNVTQFTGSQTFNAATGFTGASIVYTLQVGATGVSINSSTGLVTADTSLTGSGTKSLTVRATNGSGFADQPLSLVITALAAPVAVGTIGPWNETQNSGVKTFNAAAGFSGSLITYSLVSPPTGVTIDGSTGVVSANTNTVGVGTKALTVKATNGAGNVNQALSLVVAEQIWMSGDGTRTDANISGTDYVIRTLTASGNINIDVAGTYDILYCASGGGGGGSANGSGAGGSGGGGGFLIRTGVSLSVGTYAVSLGAGGLGTSGGTTVQGGNGGDLVAFGTTVKGGGGGGNSVSTAAANPGAVGGSGGSGSARSALFPAGGAGTAGQGNAGGAGWGSAVTGDRAAGGSGGAGGAGQAASIAKGGDGGIGFTSNFDGVSTVYSPGCGGRPVPGTTGVPGAAPPGGGTGALITDLATAIGTLGTAPGAGAPGIITGTAANGNLGVFKIRHIKP